MTDLISRLKMYPFFMSIFLVGKKREPENSAVWLSLF